MGIKTKESLAVSMNSEMLKLEVSLLLVAHFPSISFGNQCTNKTEPTLPPNDNFCLFSNYSRDELATSSYLSTKLKVTLDFDVTNTEVNEDLNRWHASVLLSMSWPDHRILLSVKIIIMHPYIAIACNVSSEATLKSVFLH